MEAIKAARSIIAPARCRFNRRCGPRESRSRSRRRRRQRKRCLVTEGSADVSPT